jgi:hypothetical protein
LVIPNYVNNFYILHVPTVVDNREASVEYVSINYKHMNFAITEITVLWDMMPYSLVERYCFRLTCCFYFQGRRVRCMGEWEHKYKERRIGNGSTSGPM